MDEIGAGSSYESDLREIRERVVQLKRETDAKAPAGHDHERLSARLDRVEGELEATREDVWTVREVAEAADDRINGGFENYRELLERLLDRTETIERRLDTLGETVLSAREREERREQLAILARTANREGVRAAVCAECEETVDLGLLVEPVCPHCETTFEELSVGRGLFGSATLLNDA